MSTDAWEEAKEMVEKHAATGGIFVKLANDGDRVCGCFVGDPLIRQVIWTGERYEPFDEENAKHKGKRPTLRLAINFLVPSESAVKVLELSASCIKDVLKLRDKYGLHNWSFEIERQGAAGDPKTKYRILPDQQLSDDQRAEIARLELHDLKALLEGTEEDEEPPSKTRPATDAVADAKTAAELVEMLKPLPRETVNAFLKKFGIARVRELKVRDARSAFAFVEALAPKSTAEVDPWS
jgi:hypothetical protein